MAFWPNVEPIDEWRIAGLVLDPGWAERSAGSADQTWDGGTYTCTAHAHNADGSGPNTTACLASMIAPTARLDVADVLAQYDPIPDWIAMRVVFALTDVALYNVGCGLDRVFFPNVFATCGPFEGPDSAHADCDVACWLVDVDGTRLRAEPPWDWTNSVTTAPADHFGVQAIWSGVNSGYVGHPGGAREYTGDLANLSTALLWRPREIGHFSLELDAASASGELSIGLAVYGWYDPCSPPRPGTVAAGQGLEGHVRWKAPPVGALR